MSEQKENKNFLKRWSDKKSGVEKKDPNKKDIKNKKKIKNQILESDEEIDKKYSNLTDKEILDKLKLPDPNKVKKEKDLDVFFKKSIPERLKRIAMRRLWRINPLISFADAEINDYADDFTDAATVIEDLQTSYVVGQGHFKPVIEKAIEGENEEDKDSIKDKIETNKNTKKIKRSKNRNIIKNDSKTQKIIQDKKTQNHPVKAIENTEQNLEEKQLGLETEEEKNNHQKFVPKNLIFRKRQ